MDVSQLVPLLSNPNLTTALQDPTLLQKVMTNPSGLQVLVNASRDPTLLTNLMQNPRYLHELIDRGGAGGAQPAVQPAVQHPPTATPALVPHQEMLLRLFDEFMRQDEGKQLASNLGKFARFVQSKTSKAEESAG